MTIEVQVWINGRKCEYCTIKDMRVKEYDPETHKPRSFECTIALPEGT